MTDNEDLSQTRMTDNEDLSQTKMTVKEYFDFMPLDVSERVKGTRYLSKKRGYVGTWDGRKLKKNCCYTEEWGSQCDKYAIRPTIYCVRHGGGYRCQHTTEDGSPCSRSALSKSDYCKAHGDKKVVKTNYVDSETK